MIPALLAASVHPVLRYALAAVAFFFGLSVLFRRGWYLRMRQRSLRVEGLVANSDGGLLFDASRIVYGLLCVGAGVLILVA
jgi:hypothetical protein